MSRNTRNQNTGRRRQLSLIGSHRFYITDYHIFKDTDRLLGIFLFTEYTQTGTQTKQHRRTYFVHCDIRDFHIT